MIFIRIQWVGLVTGIYRILIRTCVCITTCIVFPISENQLKGWNAYQKQYFKSTIYNTSVYIEFKIGGVKGKMRGVLMMTIKLKNILSWGLRWLKEMLFFKQGLAAVCTTDDYAGHEKALSKKDTFEGGNFSKTILIWFW